MGRLVLGGLDGPRVYHWSDSPHYSAATRLTPESRDSCTRAGSESGGSEGLAWGLLHCAFFTRPCEFGCGIGLSYLLSFSCTNVRGEREGGAQVR